MRIGEVHLATGHTDQFFRWVERAIRGRSFSRLGSLRGARLEGIRNDPRFKQVVDACAAIEKAGYVFERLEHLDRIDREIYVLTLRPSRTVPPPGAWSALGR